MTMNDKFYIPETISEEAKDVFSSFRRSDRDASKTPVVDDQDGWEELNSRFMEEQYQACKDVVEEYEPAIEKLWIDEVPVLDVRPKGWKDNGKIMVFIHGGGYTFFSAATTLCFPVPIAHDANFRVVSIEYSLAPAAKWQTIMEQAFRVVTSLMAKGYKPDDIVVCGLSAGGGLAGGLVLKLRDEGFTMPGALVLISPWSDITETGDSYQTLRDSEPCYRYNEFLKYCADAYADPSEQHHPYVSPVYGDYSEGYPPTLIQGGTKEIFLSNFVRLYQAIDSNENYVKLDLYEGMWHAFQESYMIPEAQEARRKIVVFLKEQLSI